MLQRIWREVVSKAVPKRVPLGVRSGPFMGFSGMAGYSTVSALTQGEASSWLFAVIDRIASSVASVQWKLFQGENELDQHPLLDLWRAVNDFYTQEEFLEVSQQHFELTGTSYWHLVRRSDNSPPEEIWPLRPDRVTPIASTDSYLAGYLYQIGQTKIPLRVEDVVSIRRVSPVDPYQGFSVIPSLLPDINAERMSAEWTAAFFRNSAEPGGIIRFPEMVDDASFERLIARWGLQHRGVANAHRVAVLDAGAEWTERKYTQADMQFTQLRLLNRDLILGAFGVPKSVMGITDDVNRANAEAGEVTFSRWVLTPRLRRIRAALNERLCPLFGPGLRFDFVDPTPLDRAGLALEGERGYRAGLLTKNEGRAKFGLDAVPDGEDFIPEPTPPANPNPAQMLDVGRLKVKALPAPTELYDTPVQLAEKAMARAWGKRLRRELSGILAVLDPGKAMQKFELSDVAGHDWDWWAKFGDAVVQELSAAWVAAALADRADLAVGEVQRRAAEWATVRGARLLRVDGDLSLAEATRARVNELVAQTLTDGESLGTLKKRLREDLAFSPARAEMVSRTETATALGQGQKGSAIMQGRNEKRWITQGASDPRVDEVCLENEAQGWIPIGDPFQGGVDTIPQHPNCMCVCAYRTAEQAGLAAPPEARCRTCGKLLAKDVTGARLFCPKCRLEGVYP